jgi:para-aminobenzoate synthetase component I
VSTATATEQFAYVNGMLATGVLDVTHDPAALDSSGFWAVAMTFEGHLTAVQFQHVGSADPPGGPWKGPETNRWSSSLSESEYVMGVQAIREHIAAGDIYQANLCRVLRAPLPDPTVADMAGLHALLHERHGAPHGCALRIGDLDVVSASPELFIGRQGERIWSSPIKGTGRVAEDLTPKDEAENVMIVDLVRNDLGVVCEPGTIHVPSLLTMEQHPGLVHLVSTVEGVLRTGTGWGEILSAAFPPGSVTGTPKARALSVLADLEKTPRGPYCGALGWIDADRKRASLAVGIRTFWREEDHLAFGTGAGITWGSDADDEWQETELKADRLLTLASGTWQGSPS